MQLPVAIFKLELSGPGSQRLYVSEIRATVDYDAFCQVCQMVFSSETMNRKEKGLTKEALNVLCQLATSESDRCLIKYSVSKSQGLSLHRKEDMIMKAPEQSEAIRHVVMKLASVRKKATLRSLGYELPGSSSDSEDSDMDQLVFESDASLNETFKQSDKQENTSENSATEDVPCNSDLCESNAAVLDPKFDSSINSSRTKTGVQERSNFYCKSDSSMATSMGTCSGCELTKGTECLGQKLTGAIDPDTISKQKEDGMIVNPTPSMQ